ncbi:MAG: glycosyltransferase family 39 protein, partial [Anaerolineae bacterium]
MICRKRARYLVAVGLLALVAFFVRAASLDVQSLWRDEVDALRFATVPWSEMLSNFTRPGWNGPLYYLLLRGWVAMTGTSEYAMRFFSLLFGVLGLPLIYVLGRRLFSPSVGLISALLMTTSPYLVWYSQEVKMYTLILALALLAIYSLRRALEGGGWPWWLVQTAATTVAFYSHILAALLIPVQVLLTFLWWPQARKRWR